MMTTKVFYNPELDRKETYTEVLKLETVQVKDINDLLVLNRYWQDSEGELWVDFDDPSENLRRAFAAYRERMGFLSSDQIRQIRQRKGYSVRQFASQLGISSSSLTQIENNQRIQAKYQDVLFRFADQSLPDKGYKLNDDEQALTVTYALSEPEVVVPLSAEQFEVKPVMEEA